MAQFGWILALFLGGAIIYAKNYSASPLALTFVAGMAIGQGFAFRTRKTSYSKFALLAWLVILLALASVVTVDSITWYQYRGAARHSGPWNNPNIYGLLMGTGAVLAAGNAVSSFKFQVPGVKTAVWPLVKTVFFAGAAGLMAFGLLRSYSRGAWVATGCAGLYLASQFSSSRFRVSSRVRHFAVGSAVVIASVALLAYWQFHHSERPLVRRALSVGNVNDFSWRNRVSAWEGTLEMMAEHPLTGLGWNRPESEYDHYYRRMNVPEAAAIQMNDYFMLGSTLGVPALVCLGMYLWQCFVRKPAGSNEVASGSEPPASNPVAVAPDLDWLRATCRAGAILLAIGFWFDGGLFKIATAAPFWILLELGRREPPAAV